MIPAENLALAVHRMRRLDAGRVIELAMNHGGDIPPRSVTPERRRRFVAAGITDDTGRRLNDHLVHRIASDRAIGVGGLSRWSLDSAMLNLPPSCRRVLVAAADMARNGADRWSVQDVADAIGTRVSVVGPAVWRLVRGGWFDRAPGYHPTGEAFALTDIGRYAVGRISESPAWRGAMLDA